MRKTRVWITLSCCLFVLAIFAWAQANRKPGLWEMTTNMTWQQSPYAGRHDHARRRPAHHAGLRDPGDDRQVRRPMAAEPQ